MVKQTGIDKGKSAEVYGLEGQRFVAGEEWMRLLLWKDEDIVKEKSVNNAVVFLTHHNAIRGSFVYNEFSDEIVLKRQPPWVDKGERFEAGQRIKDEDITHATTWLERHGISLSINTVRSAIIAAAKKQVINPPKEYLKNLVWDKVERLDHWLIDICGVKDTAYTRHVGAKWMIGAAARIFRPGCQMDNTLILEGDQGVGKSTLFRELVTFEGKSYFTDDLAPPGTKDCSIQLQGVLIVELPEMESLIRTDRNVFVPWLTRRADRYRPPYGIMLVESPRRCVFGGTWNPDNTGLFDDPTGARRYWPVTCTEINLEGLRDVRDQLWAEAVARFEKGERWWLEGSEEIDLAKEEQSLREVEDTWAEKINEFVYSQTQVTVGEILSTLNIPMEKRDRRAERRVGGHMRSLGWLKKKKRPKPYASPVWFYIHPDMLHLEESKTLGQ